MSTTRTLRATAFAALLVQGLCGCAASHAGAPSSAIARGQCGDFELDVERFWTSKTKAEVQAGIIKLGEDSTEETSERVVTKMDSLTRDWVMMQEGVCKDTLVREVMPREAYVKVSLCLRSSLIAQRTLVETLKYPTKEHLLNVDAALAKAQTDAVACQQEAIYSSYDDAPDDGAAEQAREKIAEASVYRELRDSRAQDASLAARDAAARSQTVRVKVDALNEQASQASYHAQWDDIAPFAQQALHLAESNGYDLGIARAKYWLAASYSTNMDYPRAKRMNMDALAIYRRIAGEGSREVGMVYESLAIDHSNQKEYEPALEMFRRSLAIERKLFGENSIDTAITYSRMATTYGLQGDPPSALAMSKKALAIFRRQNDPPASFNVESEVDFIRRLCRDGYPPACSPP